MSLVVTWCKTVILFSIFSNYNALLVAPNVHVSLLFFLFFSFELLNTMSELWGYGILLTFLGWWRCYFYLQNLLYVRDIETPNRYGGIQYLGFEKLTYVPIQVSYLSILFCSFWCIFLAYFLNCCFQSNFSFIPLLLFTSISPF